MTTSKVKTPEAGHTREGFFFTELFEVGKTHPGSRSFEVGSPTLNLGHVSWWHLYTYIRAEEKEVLALCLIAFSTAGVPDIRC